MNAQFIPCIKNANSEVYTNQLAETGMKKLYIFSVLVITSFAFGQVKENAKKLTANTEIRQVLTTFMDCIAKKDSITFYGLFHEEPVVWAGVYKDKTRDVILNKNSSEKTYFKDTYQEFFRYIIKAKKAEEKFYNIDIVEDGSVASVSFDYSFWEDDGKQNWGKESWGLVKIDGKWKITSVIFSIDYEAIHPEPTERITAARRKNKE